jgi:hypothetical protein
MMTRRVAVPRVMRQFATLMALSATFAFGFAANPVSLVVSNTTAPAGGWAQIQIFAAKPGSISSGHLVLNLDATFFGPGAMVGLFGASGDALGAATTNGAQLDVQFSSATGGIGQMAGLPVMVISVPVLAPASGVATVAATSPDSSVTIASGTVTVTGKLSVQKIYAGMGVIAAGTVVTVYGSGFTPSTAVAIDGVAIASAKFVSAGEIDVTLGGAAELVGKRARVMDSGVEFDYFCFQPNDPTNSPIDPSDDRGGQLFRISRRRSRDAKSEFQSRYGDLGGRTARSSWIPGGDSRNNDHSAGELGFFPRRFYDLISDDLGSTASGGDDE